MASKFKGRNYSTLRQEIIEFLRTKFSRGWDYTNLADPVVIFAETLANMGDQLHYTIDEIRRECDVATARRASSIYSYAMREGYKMMLPRGSFGTLSINTTKEQDGLLNITLRPFDEIVVTPLGESLYVAEEKEILETALHAPVDSSYITSLRKYESDNYKKGLWQSYFEDVYNKTVHVKVVLGKKTEFPFTYSDINNDSTVDLPNPLIDRNLVRLSYTNSSMGIDPKTNQRKYEQLTYVDDIISSGFMYDTFTLTPKFIGGAVSLCIEFPTNYRDIFKSDTSTTFKFEYINIRNVRVDPLDEYQDNAEAVKFPDGAITIAAGHENDPEIIENGLQYRVNFGDGIKGYTEYENALVTRSNYKKFLQNYSSLLTKDDYTNYIQALTHSHCRVYDHGDMYKSPAILPKDPGLIPRAIYVLTDANYNGRSNMWNDLRERSSRSDCIIMMPFGKDPYSIVVRADCYLVGTSIDTIATQIEQALTLYYSDQINEKIPKISKINYLVHKASDKVIKMDCMIVRDSTYGTIDTTFNGVSTLDNQEIDRLFDAFKNEKINYCPSYIKESTNNVDDSYYWLRGVAYEDLSGKIWKSLEELEEYNTSVADEKKIDLSTVGKIYYNKYPRLTYKEYITSTDKEGLIIYDEYKDYPDSFPRIYRVKDEDGEPIKTYEELIDHQYTYGEIDTDEWDISDTEIFELKHNKAKMKVQFKVTCTKTVNTNVEIKGVTYITAGYTNYKDKTLFEYDSSHFNNDNDNLLNQLALRSGNDIQEDIDLGELQTDDSYTEDGIKFIVKYENCEPSEEKTLSWGSNIKSGIDTLLGDGVEVSEITMYISDRFPELARETEESQNNSDESEAETDQTVKGTETDGIPEAQQLADAASSNENNNQAPPNGTTPNPPEESDPTTVINDGNDAGSQNDGVTDDTTIMPGQEDISDNDDNTSTINNEADEDDSEKEVSQEMTIYKRINEKYIKHHYMVPVLNKVIVLIRSVNYTVY